MRIRNFYPVLICVLFLFHSVDAHGQKTAELLELYAEQGNHEGMASPFNGVVLVADKDRIVHLEAYGFEDIDQQIPLAVDSRFMIGSITKSFTAMLVLQQVALNTIELDSVIAAYLPEFDNENARNITIHQLLSHSSGLPHYGGLLETGTKEEVFLTSSIAPEAYVRLIAKTELLFQPGTEFYYSSLGYILLGAILERVTGQPYAILLQKYITEPLSLANTGYADNAYMDAQVSQGHTFQEYGFWDRLLKGKQGVHTTDDFRHQTTTFSTGGIHSTVQDLWIWSQAVRNAELISQPLTQQMLSPNLGGYGYGWFRNHETMIRRNPGIQVTSHGGALQGYRANLAMYDDGITIIYLSNVTPLNDVRFTQNLHLAATGQSVENFKRDLLRPELGRDLETFMSEGGILAFENYYEEISRRAGYTVLPTQTAYLELLTLYLEAGFPDEGVRVVSRMMEDYAKPSQFTMNKVGYAFLKANAVDQAICYFRETTVLYPQSANAYDSLGEAYQQSGMIDDARAQYEKAVELATIKEDPALPLYKAHLSSLKP